MLDELEELGLLLLESGDCVGVSQQLEHGPLGELFFPRIFQILIDKVLPLEVNRLNVIPELLGVNIMRQLLNLNAIQQLHNELIVFIPRKVIHLLEHALQLEYERFDIIGVVGALVVGEVLDVVALFL
jgi:hypothetical protein